MNRKNALFKLAVRNVTRNSKNNRFVILSIAFGLATVFWVKCIFLGHNQNMINVATSTFIGGVQIHDPAFLKSKAISHHFADAPVEAVLRTVPGIRYSKRIFFPSLLSTARESSMGLLYGIDPNAEAEVTDLRKNLKRGRYLTPETGAACTRKEIYISEKLAEKLKTDLDGKIVVMGQATDGTTGNDLFRVAGIYDSGSGDFDENHSFVNLECARELVALPGDVHEIVLRTDDKSDLDRQTEIRGLFSAHPETANLAVTTWREFVPSLETMVRMNTGVTNMVIFTFFLITSLGVVNSMLMSVFERTQEFGIILALGMTPAQVTRIIFYEGLVIALIAGTVSTLVGYALVSYHHRFGLDITPFIGQAKNSFVGYKFTTRVYPVMAWKLYLTILATELAFLVTAGIYPALRAARLDPMESIRSR
ncbi:MAG: ABC transporter permease [Bdellovibrionales bacterium]|nr:ABC transporter permease [Bdellovibrionales bacterium]